MADPAVFTVAFYDAEAVLLPPGYASVLPHYDIPGSAESVGAPVQHRRLPRSTLSCGYYSCLGLASSIGEFCRL